MSQPPTAIPSSPFPEEGIHRQGDWVYAPLRGWIDIKHKPEEIVRQHWVRRLHLEGGYSLGQMDQERRTHSGRRSPRADIIVWRSADDKEEGREPILVVETKPDEGAARSADFWQGESYARAAGARFLVIANASSHLVYELTKGLPGKARQINDWPTAADIADERRLNALVNRLEVFDREQFQRVLSECHDLLRDNHAMTPDRAFDTISKVLFIKLHVERNETHETFTTKFLDEAKRYQLRGAKLAQHEQMFKTTKEAYETDDLFTEDDRLDISPHTFRELVGKLERFNLSKTSDDVKGIAFERFLGRTFRGELGQFFTPRPVVEFMVDMLDPKEGELICDPAAGSGGFLISVFDHIRNQITETVRAERDRIIEAIFAEYADDAAEAALDERDRRIEAEVAKLNEQLAPSDPDGGPIDTRVGRLAWQCIYGTDKEPRAARTAKMNMIMHGDGHGGIHWHDGLVNVNGIFEDRFDVVITNPPFGATVTSSQLIGATPETNVSDDAASLRRQKGRYGEAGLAGLQQVADTRNQKILDQFEIGLGNSTRKTEQMFLERCLRLLKPGGRLAIVLPNGNLNAASQAWLRRWAEGKAFLKAVVALPSETFKFSGASVTASIVFMQKFTEAEAARWEQCWKDAHSATEEKFDPRRAALIEEALPGLLHGEDEELRKLLADLEAIGVTRVLPDLRWVRKTGLVRGAPVTTVRGPVWAGDGGVDARKLKQAYTARAASVPALKTALVQLRASLKALDEEQTAAMWKHVREAFDYPVFMANPRAVGITATGETGDDVPNDLPEVLTSWRAFANQGFGATV
ncbi:MULTISPECIES: N-6 DNA methylase [Glycomyces]|uniref:N-6 DNA methylase n=2 Tax=Glycomyces TaxID=58113 RepID=A0A9X3PPE3_9ACTN|nr:N-6 DNA methylase [Glycomyces lechevalierae]MDA1387679.1 N-6 DNA methylase [Glycomyces lechevalierae]MDR7337996.1 type I restriction enzyme M protein [Glycomyces lechevalierae]